MTGRRAAAGRLAAGPAGVLLAAGLLTAVMAAPVLVAPGERFFGRELVGRHPDPFYAAARFAKPPADRYVQPLTDLPGALLARLTGSGIVAYNAVVLASFPLAALFAFLLARRLTGSTPASWVAGLLFAFSPYHVAHAAYHPQVAQVEWLPLYAAALVACLRRPSAGRSALLAAAALGTALACFYYGLVVVVLTPFGLAGWALARRSAIRRNRWPGGARRAGVGPGAGGTTTRGRVERPLATAAGALAAAAAAGLAWTARRAPEIVLAPGAAGFPASDLARYGAHAWAYVAPPAGHPLFGGGARALAAASGVADGLVEQQLTPGLGALTLAAVAVAAWVRRRRSSRPLDPAGPRLGAVPALLLVGAAAIACSLAPPGEAGLLPALWPSSLLHRGLPFFRAYARFGVVALLAVALLAGTGAAALAARGGRAARTLAAALLALAVLELAPFPPWPSRDVLPTSAHRALAGQRGPLSVLDCAPASHPGEATVPSLFPHRLRLRRDAEDCGEPGLAGVLAARGISHVLVRGDDPLGPWLMRRPLPGLRPEGRYPDALLWRVTVPPPPLYLTFEAGFSWREYSSRGTYRWMGPQGRLLLVNRAARTLDCELDLELHAFPHERRVALELEGGADPTNLTVATAPHWLHAGPWTVPPGRHFLRLEAREPAAVPAVVSGSTDRRRLTIALWDWRLGLADNPSGPRGGAPGPGRTPDPREPAPGSPR